jgi:hypothetical protein
VIIARRLGIAILYEVARLVQSVAVALAVLIFVPAAILMLLIGFVLLALMAVEDASGSSERGRACAGRRRVQSLLRHKVGELSPSMSSDLHGSFTRTQASPGQ